MSDLHDKALRVKQYTDDPVIQEAVQLVREQNYDLFLHAPNDESRRMAQAQAVALDALLAQLRATMDAGEREQLEQQPSDR